MAVGKTYDYVLVLQSGKHQRAYDWISHLLLLLAVSAMTYYSVISNYNDQRIAGAIFAVAILAAWIIGRFTNNVYRWALFIGFIGWIYLFHQWFIGILYSLAGIMEKQVKFKDEIGFDEEGITLNSFPKRKYQWHQVNNVVLKDDMLTIDLYNNRIIQKALENESTPALEKEFNEFCRSYLLSV